MRSILLRLMWACKLLVNDSFVVILKHDGLVHIKMKRPFLFEDGLQLEAQYATLKDFQDQFNKAVAEFEQEANKVNETLDKRIKEVRAKPRKKSTR